MPSGARQRAGIVCEREGGVNALPAPVFSLPPLPPGYGGTSAGMHELKTARTGA